MSFSSVYLCLLSTVLCVETGASQGPTDLRLGRVRGGFLEDFSGIWVLTSGINGNEGLKQQVVCLLRSCSYGIYSKSEIPGGKQTQQVLE